MKKDYDVLTKSIDDLDLEIGRSLLSDVLGSKDVSDSEARSVARRWFQTNFHKLRSGVCGNTAVCEQLTGKSNKTRNELFAAVLDALLKVGGFGSVPIASLTARLIHYGIEQLCHDFSQNTSV